MLYLVEEVYQAHRKTSCFSLKGVTVYYVRYTPQQYSVCIALFYCPALKLRPDQRSLHMKLQTKESLIQKTWETVKAYRVSGRHWIQIQKAEIQGFHGILVADAFAEVNRVFQRLTEKEMLAALNAKRALFITVGNPGSPFWGKSDCVTDWIGCEEDLVVLPDRLASYFDLCAFVATESQFVKGSSYLRANPLLVDCAVLPACHREIWRTPVILAFPEVNTFEYRFETRKGLRKALGRIRSSFETRADLCESLRETKDRFIRNRLRQEINLLAEYWDWHQNDGKALIPVFEGWTVMKYLQKVMLLFQKDLSQLRWGELPQRKESDDKTRYQEVFAEYAGDKLRHDDECSEYTEAIERYRTRGRSREVVLPDGSTDALLEVWR